MPNTCCWRQVESYDSLDKYENFAGENVNSGLCPIYVGGKQTPGADTMDCLGLSHLPWFCDPFKRLLFIATFLCVCQMTVFLRKTSQTKVAASSLIFLILVEPQHQQVETSQKPILTFWWWKEVWFMLGLPATGWMCKQFTQLTFFTHIHRSLNSSNDYKDFSGFHRIFWIFWPLSFFFNSSLCSKTSCFQSHKIPRLLAKLSAL